jgi:glyoxylase-like metal-dependent hydrolase (beta-lactamase superfamily II)
MDSASPIREMVETSGRTPVAVLATHGHLDHVADAHVVAGQYDIPVFIHAADRHLLGDPGAGLGPTGPALVEAFYGTAELPEPEDVREWADGDSYDLAGLVVQVVHAPGHTPGSVLLHVGDGVSTQLFSGDVLFAGSIGRTDLPGGSMDQMMATLRDTILTMPYDLAVLPGHGTATSIGQECLANPYLHQVLRGLSS